MTQVTVKELAKEVNTPVESLLQQMHKAGLTHTSVDQKVSETEKQALLTFLEKGSGTKTDSSKKITLQRKTTTTLRTPGSKTISVEVRKKKTFVKRSAEEIEAEKQKDLAKLQAEKKAIEIEAKPAKADAAPKAEPVAAKAPAAPAPVAAEKVEAPADITLPVVDAVAPAPDRKKDEVRRPVKREEDDRRERKAAAPRPAAKGKTTGRSEDEQARRGGRSRGGKNKKRANQHGFSSPAGPVVRDVNIG